MFLNETVSTDCVAVRNTRVEHLRPLAQLARAPAQFAAL
jgi:hypothetical protein